MGRVGRKFGNPKKKQMLKKLKKLLKILENLILKKKKKEYIKKL